MNITKLISDFKKNNSMFWVEANNIKLFVADEFDDRTEIIDTIKRFKPEIVDYLVSNKIFSKEDFQKRTIFKSHGNEALLSFAQQRLWFIELYEQGSNAYHIPLVIELDADTDTTGIKYTLQQIVSRHEVLRSTIEYGDSEEYGIQRVHDEPLSFEEITLTDKQDFKSLIEDDINRPFDLSTEFPIRVKFYTIEPTESATESPLNRTVLLINFHHIACDGWSIEIFQKEWAAYYEAYTNSDTDFCLPDLEIQYKDYAVWQRSYLSGEILEKQLSYWKDKLSGYQTLKLPTDYARSDEIDYSGSSQVFVMDGETSQKLRALAQRYGVTLYSVMLSSINILLSKYTGQDDIVTGSVIANRHHRQTEGSIGFFVNTQVNRTLLNRTQSFEDLIQQVHQEQIQAQLHQDLPFEKLVEELGVERDLSRHPVFQVMFGFEAFGSQYIATDEQKTYFKPLQSEAVYDIEKFDLSINIDDTREELMGQISYATALFLKDTIGRFIRHYTYLLKQLTETPEHPYSQHSLLRSEEYQQIVYDWNDTDKDYPKEKTIYQLFQDQAEKTPDNIALVYDGQQLSYKQLNEKSNQLARHIREQYKQRTKQSLTPDTLITLYLDRSLEMVIGILAVLKAGGAYVPMDIYYPQERIDYLLEDTRTEIILCQRQLSENSHTQIPQDKIIYIDLSEEFYKKENTSDLQQKCRSADLAYLIYTSGSMGKPKAVAIEHKSVVNMALSRVIEYKITERENSLQIASICFDASVEQIFVALLSGAKLTLIKKEILIDGRQCELFLNENKITHLDTVPSFLETLDFSKLKYLKRIASGGESCTIELVNRILPYIEFYNEYGPTEATVITTQYKIEKGKKVSDVIPIGKPIQNAKIFILDNYLSIVPVGIVGEMYIGGECLARGYLNSDKLTGEKFVHNPFGAGRLYRTGDLGRWRNDGQIEYIGRKDNQVKIRGFRIELGEIENALTQISGIKQCCVLAKERKTESGNNKYLVGYYVSDNSRDTLSQTNIVDKLSKVLPEYMVPGVLIAMESFPITTNGKLDKRALPDPDFSDGNNYIKPSTELEIRLCQIYGEVLGVASDQISTHQNFFRMGGNSILSIQLKAKLNRLDEFNHISVADLFKYNSIIKLIESIQKDIQTEYKRSQNIIQSNDHEIAIIGVSGAFSGSNNVDELWQLIANQLEGIRFYTKEEYIEFGIDDTLFEDPDYIPVEGKVEDIELFDPFFWEMSPNEAKLLDPQIRKFIEHCWFVLESSGYSNQRKNHHIGVFAGSGYSNYLYEHILHGEMADQINVWEASTSNDKDALATKTAYLLDLTGPANSINTACSTGLVCVVEACKNLQLGTCDMALAGGVTLSTSDQVGYIYEEGMILSKDGHCRTFDKDASGTTGGSGVAVVLLKRLQDAIKDNDTILGVIKGYATNNDGARKTGYTAPSLIGQSECIINAQAMAGVSPDQIDYVECHGTATHLGDPIEVQALKEAFQYNQPKEKGSKHKTVLGALKANIGHTDSSAGTASLIKVVAMLQHNIIPGQVNYNEPNPELHLDQTSFEIIKENKIWPASQGGQRLAGVSSFGIGGTNAHVIIGNYIAGSQNRNEILEISSLSLNGKENPLHYIIPISAKSRQSLENYKQALLNYLTETKESNHELRIQDIVYTLQERREHFNFRNTYIAEDIDELISEISQDTSYAQITEGNNRIVFMFPGQGTQYYHMAKCLYNKDPFFRNTITLLITVANQHLPINLYDVMYPLEKASSYDINETQWSQISLFILEYALARYLEHLGVKADAYIGHSIGEYVAAVLSGVFTLEDAIKLVIARGKLMQSMQPGSMLAINAGEETLKAIIKKYNCEIAVINSIEDTVVSGDDLAIKELKKVLDNKGIATVILNTSHAYHSKMMEQAAEEFLNVLEDIQLNKPTEDFISNITGEIAGENVTTAAYWCDQLRNTVQFAKGINSLSKKYNYQVSFIEVGTGKGLSSFVNKYKNLNNYKSIQTVQLLKSKKETDSIPDKATENKESKGGFIATLWMNGIIAKPNETKMFTQSKLDTGLPTYKFNYQKCWLEKNDLREIKKFNSIDEMFYVRSWERANLETSPVDIENIKHKNILVLINKANTEQSKVDELLDLLNNHCDNLSYVIHQHSGFDFSNALNLSTILDKKTAINPIDLIIYISPSIDTNNVCLDIFAVRTIFDWSKDTGNKIPEFVSISFDNFEVIGNEPVQEKPSIIYGVTKSIPFEYFSSGIKAIHIDISSQDKSDIIALLAASENNEEKDLIVVRGKYQWIPTYKQVKFPESLLNEKNNLRSEGSAYLITGGLGALGYAYANHIAQKEEKCKIILLGRTVESKLRKDYKARLNDLRMTEHDIIYSPIDIGSDEALSCLKEILLANNISSIEVILHAAGVAAKSAIVEKNYDDISQVISPKITGTENLINLSDFVQVNNLVSCSSVSSILPSFGNMEYTAANLYLDEISYRNHPGINYMVALNLNQISDSGMAVDFMENSLSADGKSLDSIKSQEFPGIVQMILQTKTLRNIILSRYDFNNEHIDNFKILTGLNYEIDEIDNVEIKILEENYTETEYKVAQIFGGILGVEQISLHDDFFRIGGNSISAIQVSHKMSNALGCDVRVADVFKYNTISQLISHSIGQTQTDIPKLNMDRYVLSFAQERLWFIEQYERGSNAYHLPAVFELDAETDIDGIKYALQQIVSRHEVLRSTIEQLENGEHVIQVVHEEPLLIEEIILSDKENFEYLIAEDINRPFDLSIEYPIRVKLYYIQTDIDGSGGYVSKTLLLLNTHHIASDGWSIDIFEREMFDYYEAYINNDTNFSLPPLEIQYKDYAIWQRSYLSGEILEKQLSYWKDKLSGYQTLELPTDYVRPDKIDYRGASKGFTISEETSQKLRKLAQRYGVTLYSVMLSSINILLSKYTGQEDIVIGSPIANRHHRQTEGLIGFFVNTQINRTMLNKSQSFDDLINQVHQEQIQAQLHQDLPFEKLVDELGVERDPSRHPVFQLMFILNSFATRNNSFAIQKNNFVNQNPEIDEQKSYLIPFQTEDVYQVEKFDLSIFIEDSQKEIMGVISYATALFHDDTIERFISHYMYLLEQLTDAPEQPYSQHSLLSPQEYEQIVYDWNATEKNYPKEKTIYQLFHEQVEKTPDSIALDYEGQRLTYQQLNEKSNQLARNIRTQYQKRTKQELDPNTLIAIHLDRSLEMVIGILAIQKAGGAYVPIDTNYPQERIDYLLEDIRAELILCQRQPGEDNNNHPSSDKLIYIDLTEEFYKEEDTSNLPQHSKATDLAYVIYTSGTTGKPKGVKITHKSLNNLVTVQKRALEINSKSKVLQYASLIFDASVWEIFSALSFGAQLSIIPSRIRQDAQLLCDYLVNSKITIALLPPALLSIMPYTLLPDLKTLLVGGDLSSLETMKKWSEGRRLINAYGPTESTVIATMHQYEADDKNTNMGKPIANTSVYVLDKNSAPVPIGIIGELYIGGAGLAQGYLNKKDLTEERFIPNSFATKADKAKGHTGLYKTGDLVRWLPDGNLEYIGRNDSQVKIRGFRIELGEIEHALSQITGIKQSCVLAKERETETGSDKYLVAYYVLDSSDETITQAVILEKLSQQLPEYMLPSTFVAMESFPITTNGKLDKRVLPDPDFNLSGVEYVAPSNETEATVCSIWQKVLGLDRIGITDNFFRIGGNSILAIQVSHRMSRALECDVKVADIFKYKTISQLLTHTEGQIQITIPKTDSNQAILSFAQERLWFIEQYEGGTNAYHIPEVLELDSETDIESIKYALQQIVSRHEVLRSTIEQVENEEHGIQRVHDEPLFFEEITLTDKEDLETLIKEDINRPFDLSTMYPIRIKFYNIQSSESTTDSSPDRTLMLINFHHIASDAWSIEIFHSELFTYYEAYFSHDTDFSLPPLEIQYKDYATWQRTYFTGEVLEKQLNYWKHKLSGYQTLELPTDYVRPTEVDYGGSSRGFTLSKEISKKLRRLAQRCGVTLNSLILSSINILLSKYTGQEDIVIGSPIANRHHRQTEGLIGFFVNTQINRTVLDRSQSFEDLIKQVHHEQTQAQLYQDLPFEKLVDELGVERDPSRHPVFQVMFILNSFAGQTQVIDEQRSYQSFQTQDVYEVEKFDLSFFMYDEPEELTGQISYATALFHKDTIERLTRHYIYLLEQLTEAPEQPYSQHSLLSPEEYEQIVYDWNDTDKDYPKEKTIYQLFQEQAEKTPDNIALVYEGQQLSYKQFNEKSNQLARHIRKQYQKRTKQELGSDTLIALYLDRSLEMVIGILAVLKAGGAYVPMDIYYPQERIDYILEDTRAELILSQRQLYNHSHTQLAQDKVVYIDLEEKFYNEEDTSNLPQHSKATDLAYVIYTSGSSGKPKGVMVEQGSVVNLVNDLLNKYSIDSSERFLLFANYVFDASVEQMYLALLSGGALYVIENKSIIDSKNFQNYILKYRITHLHSTPSFLSYIDPSKLHILKRVVFGAEYLAKQLFDEYKKIVPVVINEYGPTESTITSLVSINSYLLSKATIQNTKAYVLDSAHNPVPISVAGELYIGGAGVARGYLNRPDLTVERFIPDPFGTGVNKAKVDNRLYKTGDVVRWLSDGKLEYVGRNDNQVKIRGFRIELGEIEHALSQITGIRQSCVLAKERKTETGSDKYLVGYYVSDKNNGSLTQIRIIEKLSQMLPEYMVPAAFVVMESFPLTINGKLDKKALPDPDFNSSGGEYVAPTNNTEAVLCEIWQDVLGLEQVGVTDDFFRIGGDSILSIQVSGRIRRAGFNCQVKEIFEYRIIAKLAVHLDKKNAGPAIQSEQGILTGKADLLPIQQWFLEKVDKGELTKPNHWNQSFLVRVPALVPRKLVSIIKEIVAYHDVLRIQYIKEQDNQHSDNPGIIHWKQVYQPSIVIPEFKILDVSKHTETEVQNQLTDWQSGFDLERGPLFQAGYLYGYEDGSARIYFALHHMVVDAVSWSILSDDIRTLYEGRELPAKGSSYRLWVESMKSYAEQHHTEASYWEEQLKNISSYPIKYYEQERHGEFFELDETLTRSLLQEVSRAYHTEINDLLLTALAYALKEINQNNIQCITLEGHGREDINSSIDHSKTVGWFTTMFPIKLELQNNLEESIQFIKEGLRNIPNKGIGFGVFATDSTTNFTQQDLPPVSFNYFGQFDMNEGDWQIAGEGSGESIHPANMDPNLININGMVSNGKLWFSIVTKLGETTTKQLSDSFKTALTKIIQHCKEKLKKKEGSYTPSDFKSVRISQLLLSRLETASRANQNEIVHIYPATSLQQGFIYHVLSQPADDAYREQILYDYDHTIDTDKYIKAWELCISQYPILRTAFNWEEDIIQVIYKYGKLEYEEHDISHLITQQERDAAIETIQVEDRKRSFDLTKPTLLRLHIIKQSAAYYTILKSEHHSISDGWSGPILFTSLYYYYQELLKNKNPDIIEDTAYLQAQEYISQHKGALEEYWKTTLSEVESANDINALLSEPIDAGSYKQVEKPESNTLELTGDIYDAIKTFSQTEGITLNVIVQFIWHKMLHTYSNSLQSIVGTTVSGRDLPIEGIEESVGLYINTLPLIINWENDNTIQDQLHQIQQKITELNIHSFAELAKLQRDGERIFHSLFVYENYPVPKEDKDTPEISISDASPTISIRNSFEKVDYPLSIIAYEYSDTLTIQLLYDGTHLTEEKAQQHIETLEYIIHQVIKNPKKPQRQISLLRDEEYEKIIYQWNATDTDYPKNKTIYQLFQEQVEKTPDNIALVYEKQEMTYKELNEKSNQLARHIREQYQQKTKQELPPDTLIALYLDRSLEMVIGILGVLKAGGAYVPMDIDYPQERIDYLLEDTRTELILSQRHLSESNNIQLPPNKVVHIDLSGEFYNEEDTSNLPQHSTAKDLAYVLFTSGTTGKPKGVMLEHLSVYKRVVYMISYSGITSSDYYLFKTNYVFDVSISDIFTHLCAGAKLQVTKYLFELRELNELLLSNKFTSLHLVPSQYDLLSSTINNLNPDKIYFSGEALTERILSDLDKNIRVYNYYGPTETGEVTVSNPLLPADASVIGKLFSDCRQYVLDQNKNPVPIGVLGELYIGGAGLARGYLNCPDLTEERFVPNPFTTEADKAKGYTRLYKTGDLVRWLPDGNLEYIGRNDDQVKINGYRIELAEIEHALSQITGIRQSCVLAREIQTAESSIKYLAGYYVLDNENNDLTQTAILNELTQILPEYMLPTALVEMESFPLTPNGKLDKKSLPDPDFNSSEEEYVAPITETEAAICNIWQEALGLDRVGITDNFFRIGGNSILAIQVSHRMSKTLGCDVKVADVFKLKTIQMLLNNLSVKRVNPDNVEWDVLINT